MPGLTPPSPLMQMLLHQQQQMVQQVSPPPPPDHATDAAMGQFFDDPAQATRDALWYSRYGMGEAEKSMMTMGGQIPGGKPPGSEQEFDEEDRRASAYLFAKNWGKPAEPIFDIVNIIRQMGIPGLSDQNEDSLQAIAREAFNQGLVDRR